MQYASKMEEKMKRLTVLMATTLFVFFLASIPGPVQSFPDTDGDIILGKIRLRKKDTAIFTPCTGYHSTRFEKERR